MHKPYRWGDKAPPTVQRLRELRRQRKAAVQAKRDHQRFVIRHRLMHGSEEERDQILRALHGDSFGDFSCSIGMAEATAPRWPVLSWLHWLLGWSRPNRWLPDSPTPVSTPKE